LTVISYDCLVDDFDTMEIRHGKLMKFDSSVV